MPCFFQKNTKIPETKHIKPFFTATYSNSEIETPIERNFSGTLKFVFVGTLSEGKRPLLAIQIIEALYKQGKNVCLDMYGERVLKEVLQNYIEKISTAKIPIVTEENQSENKQKLFVEVQDIEKI